MIHRTAYSNLGETEPTQLFVNPNEKPILKTWLMGMSIITVESAIHTIYNGANSTSKAMVFGKCQDCTERTASLLYEHETLLFQALVNVVIKLPAPSFELRIAIGVTVYLIDGIDNVVNGGVVSEAL